MSRIQGAISAVANAPTYRFLQAGIFVVLGIAFATSFSSGSSGARILGYQEQFVSAVPLICDIVAALAMVVHGRVRDDKPMRKLAAWFVLVPMLLSWAANALDHLLRAPAQPYWSVWAQRGWIAGVVIFAGLAPVAVAGLLHFMARYVEHQQRTTVGSGEEKRPETVVETVETAVESEPEFVEPPGELIARPLFAELTLPTMVTEPAVAETAPAAVEVDAETIQEIDEIEIHRVMRDTKPRVSREVATVMVRDGCSRATAYRRVQKEAGDAAALA